MRILTYGSLSALMRACRGELVENVYQKLRMKIYLCLYSVGEQRLREKPVFTGDLFSTV